MDVHHGGLRFDEKDGWVIEYRSLAEALRQLGGAVVFGPRVTWGLDGTVGPRGAVVARRVAHSDADGLTDAFSLVEYSSGLTCLYGGRVD